MIFFLSSPLAILVTANIGYLIAIFFALSGFIWLRKDAPLHPRPVRLGRGWLAVAWLLSLFTAVVVVVGAASAELAGYGGLKEVLIAVGILTCSLLLYAYRRVVQDRVPALPPVSQH
jgi:amino acid transporter